jgi:hypothetical protein
MIPNPVDHHRLGPLLQEPSPCASSPRPGRRAAGPPPRAQALSARRAAAPVGVAPPSAGGPDRAGRRVPPRPTAGSTRAYTWSRASCRHRNESQSWRPTGARRRALASQVAKVPEDEVAHVLLGPWLWRCPSDTDLTTPEAPEVLQEVPNGLDLSIRHCWPPLVWARRRATNAHGDRTTTRHRSMMKRIR